MKQQTLTNYVALKAEGQKTIYFAECGGLDFLFRPLTYNEYKLILELEEVLNGAHINDAMLRFCMLYSEIPLEPWLNEADAILPDKLAEAVLKASGFQDNNQFLSILAEEREAAGQVESLMQIYICTAFRSIRPEEFGGMTLEEQLHLFAMAEAALGKPIPIEKIMAGEEEGSSERGPSIPITPGMESTELPPVDDLIRPEAANLPNWKQLAKGKTQW